jgi:predicted membrane protein
VLGAAIVGVLAHIPVVALLLGDGDNLADLEAQVVLVGGLVVEDGLDFVHGDWLQ